MRLDTSLDGANHTLIRSPSFKNLLKLAIPIALGMASLSFLGMVETMILGHYNQQALVASASANYIFFVYLSAFSGFAISIQSQVARHFEHKQHEALNFTSAGLIQLLILAALFITFSTLFSSHLIKIQIDDSELIALASEFLILKSWSLIPIAIFMGLRGFWHGANQPKIFLSCLVVSHLFTGVLCYLLVFGKFGVSEYGLLGSAIATLVCMSLGSLCLLVYSFKPLKLIGHYKTPSKTTLRAFTKSWQLSWPTSLQQLIFALGTAIFMGIIAKTSEIELAAGHLLITLSLVLILPVIGFGMAATTFISQSYGQFKRRQTCIQSVQEWYQLTVILSLSTVTLVGLLLWSAPNYFLQAFTKDQDVINAAYWPLIILVPSLIFEALTISTKQSLYALHRNQTVLKILTSTQWLILLPTMLIIYISGYGSLEIYTLCHALQRALNCAWLYRAWNKTITNLSF